MQAVILAAGKGTRLHCVTKDSIPKSMVQVAGNPILEYVFQTLPSTIDEIIVVIGHRGEKIKEYFEDSYGGVKITYVEGVKPKGTGYALMQARSFIKTGYFLLLNSDDLYYPEDLEALLVDEPAILVSRSENPERFGACVTDGEGMLCEILEKKDNPPTNLVNIGAYLLNHEIFDVPMVTTENGELNLAEQIGAWAKKRPVRTIEAHFWQPINNKEELDNAEDLKGLLPKIFK